MHNGMVHRADSPAPVRKATVPVVLRLCCLSTLMQGAMTSGLEAESPRVFAGIELMGWIESFGSLANSPIVREYTKVSPSKAVRELAESTLKMLEKPFMIDD